MRNHFFFSLVLCIILCTSISIAIGLPIVENTDNQSQKIPTSYSLIADNLTERTPITIDENSDFQAFPGSGTPSNPYVIENYFINSSSFCIRISNTNAYYIIRNCLLAGTERSTWCKIDLNLVSNGIITNNTIITPLVKQGESKAEGGTGISLIMCPNHLISDNNIQGFRNGVWIAGSYHGNLVWQGSDNCYVRSNKINDCMYGIALSDSEHCLIDDNSIWRSTYGIRVNSYHDHGHNANITNNLCADGFTGLEFENSGKKYGATLTNCIVDSNIFSLFHNGIDLKSASYCNFTDNSIVGNFEFGVTYYAGNCLFEGNRLANNDVNAKRRGGAPCLWQNNFWDDADEDASPTPYPIDGGAYDENGHFLATGLPPTIEVTDQQVFQVDTEAILTWSFNDTDLLYYIIKVDAISTYSGFAESESITVDVNTTESETSVYEAWIYDEMGNNASILSTVKVNGDLSIPISLPTLIIAVGGTVLLIAIVVIIKRR